MGVVAVRENAQYLVELAYGHARVKARPSGTPIRDAGEFRNRFDKSHGEVTLRVSVSPPTGAGVVLVRGSIHGLPTLGSVLRLSQTHSGRRSA